MLEILNVNDICAVLVKLRGMYEIK